MKRVKGNRLTLDSEVLERKQIWQQSDWTYNLPPPHSIVIRVQGRSSGVWEGRSQVQSQSIIKVYYCSLFLFLVFGWKIYHLSLGGLRPGDSRPGWMSGFHSQFPKGTSRSSPNVLIKCLAYSRFWANVSRMNVYGRTTIWPMVRICC